MDYGSLGYNLVKSGHIVSVIAWMAAMLYLPRLFVYHAGAARGSAESETFKVMERRLLKAIMTPAMATTWIFGLLLAWGGGFYGDGWLHAKLALVIILSALHGFLTARSRILQRTGTSARPAFSA